MCWYYLSRTRIEAITRLQTPEQASDVGEEAVPRLCVAPTVWQALLSIGGFGVDYYIYQIEVYPVPSRFARDAGVTGEHVVTQEILDRTGGSLPAHYVGRVYCDGQLFNLLNVHRWAGYLTADAAEERVSVWTINGDRWKYRRVPT